MSAVEELKETVEQAEGGADLRRGTQTLPALVLAHTEGGQRPPEFRFLPAGGLELGRGGSPFDGGPLNDNRLSRRHAAVRFDGASWRLEDLGSRNGTWLNGQRVQQGALNEGDVIRIGDTLLVFGLCHLNSPLVPASLVGVSAAMGQVRAAIDTVGSSESTVLITGESGTGKEVVARALHDKSGRRGRLVAVNCGAVAEGLLAAEFFGHAKGAFTGATEARHGLFRDAEGGTLFLDEVGETPAALQVQLLRALETRTVRPVGTVRDVVVDVRVVAATNRDLPAAVRAGTFRIDLYARLAQWQITLPPLRERRVDIPFLAAHLLAQRGMGRPLGCELVEVLLSHRWPFNVRGLLNILQVAALSTPPGTPLAVTPEVRQALDTDRAMVEPPEAEKRSAAPSPPAPAPAGAPTRPQLEELLAASGGRVAEAARRLGCTRQQLYRWLDQQGLDPDAFRGR